MLVVVFASVSFQPSFGDIGECDRYQKRANSIALKHSGTVITSLKLGCFNWVHGEVVFRRKKERKKEPGEVV